MGGSGRKGKDQKWLCRPTPSRSLGPGRTPTSVGRGAEDTIGVAGPIGGGDSSGVKGLDGASILGRWDGTVGQVGG